MEQFNITHQHKKLLSHNIFLGAHTEKRMSNYTFWARKEKVNTQSYWQEWLFFAHASLMLDELSLF